MSTASYFFCYIAQQIMQVVVNLKVLFFLLIVTPFFPSKRAWQEKSSKSFQQFFYSNVPIGVSKRNWRSNRLLPTSWNQKKKRGGEQSYGTFAIFLTWKTEAHARFQQPRAAGGEKSLRKHRISLDFSDVWCINDLWEWFSPCVRIKWWSKIDYNFDTWFLG